MHLSISISSTILKSQLVLSRDTDIIQINSISSGFPYPLPLHLIPLNIYLIFRLIISLMSSKPLSTKTAYLKQHNHKAAPPFAGVSDDPDVTWFFPSLPEIDLPLACVPKNAIACGPIIMKFEAVADIDAELSKWLARSPTVVINLGSLYRFDKRSAEGMIGAIEILLQNVDGVQVLWKMSAVSNGDYWVKEMRMKFGGEQGRVRIEEWISAEMGAVLASETVLLAVHHGGASSYYEAIRSVTYFLHSLSLITLQ